MADLGEESVEVKPSIIMKVDAPPEDNTTITSQGGSMSNAVQNDTVKTPGKPIVKTILPSSRLNSNNPFTMRSSILSSPKLSSGVVLRPSQLGSKVDNKTENTKSHFALNPSRLNPFAKGESSDESNCSSEKNSNNSSNSSLNETKNGSGTNTPKFVPLVVTESKSNSTSNMSSTSVASTSNFVFGQNLRERVLSETVTENSTEEPIASTSCTNANGTSELLFSSAVKKSTSQEVQKEVKSLTESAREYEESRANKRKYEEVVIVTGEEDEKNILQINCKLFAFDKATGNWQERGRGTLRLNDKEIVQDNINSYIQSRLVIRTAGSLKVVLNTKIWAEMTIDRASPKSLRLTAMDGSGQIKVFLIMASSEEINQLQRLLESRVQSEVDRQKKLKNSKSEPEVKKQAVEKTEQ